MMKGTIEEADIMCIVCQELPDYPHTSKCCGCVLCETCVNMVGIANLGSNSNCPKCRCVNPSFEKNMFLQNMINKFPAICKYECGHVSQVSDIKTHQKTCSKRIFECNHCTFKGEKKQFLYHISSSHEDDTIQMFDKLNQNTPQSTNQIVVNPLNEVKNSLGMKCHIGETSKFFCGGSAQHRCSTCDGKCGPNNGCNCPPCMELDLQYRFLKGKNVLINGSGRMAFHTNGSFYCNTQFTDGVCGQNAFKCRFCKSLTSDYPIYKHLL